MRKINIIRQKSIVGAAIRYYCVLNLSPEKFQQNIGLRERLSLGFSSEFLNGSNQIFPISNGEVISIELTEQENKLFVVAFNLGILAFSDEIIITTGTSYLIKTTMGLGGNQILISKI